MRASADGNLIRPSGTFPKGEGSLFRTPKAFPFGEGGAATAVTDEVPSRRTIGIAALSVRPYSRMLFSSTAMPPFFLDCSAAKAI